jgi:hypothetical protein
MPNEPVQCPNCGGGDVRQLAPDSYRCEHCHTGFHWVDPTKRTVVHKPGVCKCGRVAAAVCCRCGQLVCKNKEHGQPLESWWNGWVGGWLKSNDVHHECDWFEPNWLAGFVMNEYDVRIFPEFARPALERSRVPTDKDAILCATCGSECSIAWLSVMGVLRKAAERGGACAECFSDHLQGRCAICGVGVCSQHGIECGKCHQLACAKHVVTGQVCTKCGTPEQEGNASQASPWLDKVWKCLGLGK